MIHFSVLRLFFSVSCHFLSFKLGFLKALIFSIWLVIYFLYALFVLLDNLIRLSESALKLIIFDAQTPYSQACCFMLIKRMWKFFFHFEQGLTKLIDFILHSIVFICSCLEDLRHCWRNFWCGCLGGPNFNEIILSQRNSCQWALAWCINMFENKRFLEKMTELELWMIDLPSFSGNYWMQ